MIDQAEQLRQILDHDVDGRVVVDENRHIVFANVAAGGLLGTSPAALVGTWLASTCRPGAAGEMDHPGPAGHVLRFRTVPMRWRGRPATLLCVRDVTEQQRSEVRLAGHLRINDAVMRLTRQAAAGVPQGVLQEAAAALACECLGVRHAVVWRHVDADDTLRVVAATVATARHEVVAATSALAPAQAWREAGPTVVQAGTAEAEAVPAWSRAEAIASSLYVAIPALDERAGQAWGVLAVHAVDARVFTPHEVDLLRRLAAALAAAAGYRQLLSRERKESMLLRAASRVTRIGGWELDVAGDRVIWSKEVCAIHGLPEQPMSMSPAAAAQYVDPRQRELVRGAMRRLLHEGVAFDHELRSLDVGRQPLWIRVVAEPVRDAAGRVVGARGAVQDITRQKTDREAVRHMAVHDPLTQLPNRRGLEDRLRRIIASCRASGQHAALMLLDLDHFKAINDSLGHDQGDALLRQVASRLVDGLRRSDVAARFGGDEFVLVIAHLDMDAAVAARQAEAVGSKLLARLRLVYRLGAVECHNTQSLGVTVFGGAAPVDAMALLKQADLALYQAKADGRDRLCLFVPDMLQALSLRLELVRDMRQGIAHGQFDVHYQPQVDAAGRVLGAEVLARWQHPVHGLLAPARFIPVAERTGMIHALGEFVLRRACEQLVRWAEDPRRAHLHLAVNISAQQLHRADFLFMVRRLLDETGANPERLVFELTESVLIKHIEPTIATMNALRRQGVRFALDDFGTGYSSLNYLKQLPLAQLKVDRGFVAGVCTNPDDASMVRTILALADALGLETLAEGVETSAQQAFLAHEGCQLFQGFMHGRPLSDAAFASLADASWAAEPVPWPHGRQDARWSEVWGAQASGVSASGYSGAVTGPGRPG